MYQGLIIDFGGVLSTPFDASMRTFCLSEGLEPDALRRVLTTDPTAQQLLTDLERGAAGQTEFGDYVAQRLNAYPYDFVERITAGLKFEPAVRDAVKTVRRRGVRVAVLSNSLGSEPYDLFARFHLDRLVDVVVASDQVRMRKPDPDIYRLAADRLGVAPESCVYADDSAKFLEPARALGMTVVHATDPRTTAKALDDLF